MKEAVENKTATSGKTYTRVVFLMAQNPDTDRWEPMAYFPDLYWDAEKKTNVSYMHNGQHGACCEAFALLDCKAPTWQHKAAVARLKKELEHLDDPYVLTVLDSAEWLKSKGERAAVLDSNVRNLTQTTANEDEKGKVIPVQEDFLDSLYKGIDEEKAACDEIRAIAAEVFADLVGNNEAPYDDGETAEDETEAEETETAEDATLAVAGC